MKKKLQLRLAVPLSAFIFGLCAVSCSMEEMDYDAPPRDFRPVSVSASTRTVTATTIYNPFLLDNVRRSASAKGMTRSGDIQATHYYVRFRPATDELHGLIQSDESLECFSYPLDVHAPEGAMCYIDYDQPEGAPQFIFTWVPVDYVFPTGVDYDILGELVLGEETDDYGDDGEGTRSDGDDGFVGTGTGIFLMSGGLGGVITDPMGPDPKDPNDPDGPDGPNNPDIPWTPGGGGTGGGGSTPRAAHQGTITAWDDVLQRQVPLQGVMVRVKKNMFDSATVQTDANGNFRCETYYGNPCDLSIIWNNVQYKILTGASGQAELIGPKDRGLLRWNKNITSADGMQLYYATAHRAAWRYFYGDTDGLGNIVKAPNNPLSISVHDTWGRAKVFEWWTLSFPKVKIYTKYNNGNRYSVSTILSTAYHELGHVQHHQKMPTGGLAFFDVNFTIVESWASFVEWHLTLLEYTQLGHTQGTLDNWRQSHWLAYQAWPYDGVGSSDLDGEKEYSSLFIDLVDNYNQSSANFVKADGTSVRYPNDTVTGYTPATLVWMLGNIYSMNGVKQTLKNNKPTGVTDTQIDNLFVLYAEYWRTGWVYAEL